MSTYNGGEIIERQVKSIINQKDVDISLLIRDDGSEDNTRKILKTIVNKYKNINVEYGNNLGWKRSFLELVYSSSLEYDYYGFSDQDDIWLNDKIISLINLMEDDVYSGPKLAHCNSLSVDMNLKVRKEQEDRISSPPGWKQAIATEYFQGCGMLWNHDAMKLIRKYRPKNVNLAHDYWVGLVCYLFGQVYFCSERKFYHIRYNTNGSEDGSVKKGRLNRFKKFFLGKDIYMNPAEDLLEGFTGLLSDEQVYFLKMVKDYKYNTNHKYKIFIDKSFARPSICASIFFKMTILTNNY